MDCGQLFYLIGQLFLYLCVFVYTGAVVLVNLLRSNSTRMGGYLGQLCVLICSRDLVFAKFQIPKEIIIAFTFFVQHRLR